MVTSNRTIKWIESLADQELDIRRGERASIDICTTKDEVLLAETSAFVRELKTHCEYLVKLFNQRVNDETLLIRIQEVEPPAKGFHLNRNDFRLTVTCPRLGVVQFTCFKQSKGSKPTVMFTGLAEGDFSAFHDVEWHYLGNPVGPEQVARHYLTEFIQTSRSYTDN